MKLSQAVQEFRTSRLSNGYSANTLITYDWALAILGSLLGDPEVENITKKDLENYMFHLRMNYVTTKGTKLSGSSLDNAWKAVRSLFGWLNDNYGIERPDLKLTKPKYTQDDIKAFTPAEVNKLLAACAYTKKTSSATQKEYVRRRKSNNRDRAMITFLIDTGVRIGELCRMNIGDVDMANGEVRVAPEGTGQKTKARTVYIGKGARQDLRAYLKEREEVKEDESLFVSENDKRLDQHTINHMMHRLGERAGVKDVHPHRFRHTFATEFLRGGGDVFTLKRLLGHATLGMVQRYLQMAEADDAAAHRKASPVDRLKF
jgi:integrase/recombinase XerD